MKKLTIGQSTQNDILRINLAYTLEIENPHLNFFEINQLANDLINSTKKYESNSASHLILINANKKVLGEFHEVKE